MNTYVLNVYEQMNQLGGSVVLPLEMGVHVCLHLCIYVPICIHVYLHTIVGIGIDSSALMLTV